MQYILQLDSWAPFLPVNLTVNVRRIYNSADVLGMFRHEMFGKVVVIE